MKTILILILFMVSLPGTYAQEIAHKNFDLHKYSTFGFTEDDDEFLNSHVNAKRGLARIKNAITSEMKERGIQLSDNPELLLNLGVKVEEKVQTRETDIRDMHYMGQRNYHWEVEEIPVGTYKEGTVKIDFIDSSTNNMVNQAVVSEIITKNKKRMEKRINKMIKKTFSKMDK
jgi:predicted NUDIX family phosphoesterase